MSRATTSSQRNLTLTEELEKLEQTITLTLQEIDHNFSRAHRIVTTSILPIVEQYAKHSEAVWEGSKFWKQFFEASANVSLSGYEELAQEGEEEDSAISHTYGNSTYDNSQHGDETLQTGTEHHHTYDHDDDSILDNGDISGSTPRAPRPRSAGNGIHEFADYGSPYETLKREYKPSKTNSEEADLPQLLPTTPGTERRLPRMSMSPGSSPFASTSYLPSTKRTQDPLLHRVMDKNYRLQATPHTAQKAKMPLAKPSWRDMASPTSSSPIQAPQLHHEIFSSPIRQPQIRPGANSNLNAPRTPGVSVQTPARGKARDVPAKVKDEITWESDSDEDADDVYKQLGMSPPKTIQFAIAPGRLLQTPAREASKRIVEDLLMTAGGGDYEEDSPSMVKPGSILDDSF